jgi:hypothetical protein
MGIWGKRILKVLGSGVAGFGFFATVFSLFLGIYGPEKIKAAFISIFDDFAVTRAILQVTFSVTLLIVIFAAVFCMVQIGKIRQILGSEYENNEKHLKEIFNFLEKEKALGIVAINLRKSVNYTNDSYKRIFQNTSKELVISGHSLNKTISTTKSSDLRYAFMDAIIRLIKNNCSVKILLVKPFQSEERKRKRKEFTKFIEETYKKLRDKEISPELIFNNFFIKEIDFLPYYIVKNESILHIAHYTFGEYISSDDSKMHIFEATSNIGYGEYCYSDFISCFDSKAEYIEQYREMFKREANA